MDVIITNKNCTITLNFVTETERQAMKKAIENCIKNPDEYPLINYSDRKDDIIFSAEYLKQSLIKFPK